MRGNILLTSVLLSLLLLCGCGNGSGSDRRNDVAAIPSEVVDPTTPGEVVGPPVDMGGTKTGFLIDSAVSGVTYETPTHQGVTDLNGGFQYEQGETVRFMIGDTLLGEVMGQEEVTPFDLAGSEIITGINITWALDRHPHPTFGDPFPSLFVTDALWSRGDQFQFHTVLNIAVLLQSLDRDADPANGIEITPAVTAFFEEISLDLSQGWEAFRNEPALRHAVWLANTQDHFNEPHGVVSPAPALKHLYESLGINARTVAISQEQWDVGYYSYKSAQYDYEYDASGNLTRAETDDQGDGTPDHIVNYEYDADGNVVREETSLNFGGLPNNEIRWQYDASGNPPRIEWDWDGDGLPDFIENWQYDAEGNTTQLKEWEDEDGLEFSWRMRQYYADGNLARTEWDSGENEPPWRIDSYEYDVHGHLTRHEVDRNRYSTPDEVEIWEYDSDFNQTRYEHHITDEDRDTNSTFIDTYIGNYEYDVHGNLTWHETPRFNERYEYDANDNLTRVEVHTEISGAANSTRTWQYDTNSGPTRYELHEVVDGFPDRFESENYQYNAVGKLTQLEGDGNGDGRLDVILSYDYDTNGNLTRVAEDLGLDGTINASVSWQYDTSGNLIRYEKDDDGDGAPELTRHYKATGWGHFFQFSRPDDPRPP